MTAPIPGAQASDAPQVWRVLCEGGIVRDVPVHATSRGEWWASCDHATGWAMATPREAVVALCGTAEWAVTEVLAPGVASRAEALAALRADHQRLREGFGRAVDAHEGNLIAVWRALGHGHEPPSDVAAITDAARALRAHADGEPARTEAAVRAETGRCIAACKHIAAQCPGDDDRDLALTCAEAVEVDAPDAGGGK